MTARLAAGMLVGALRRRVESAGGFVTVLARGDEQAGSILVLAHHGGRDAHLLERVFAPSGGYRLISVTRDSRELAELENLARNRRTHDPDLWLIEVDVADAQRFTAETLASD